MKPAPKMSPAAPYRWVPSVTLNQEDVEALLQALPDDSHLLAQLLATVQAAEELADHLNEIEQGGQAA